MPLLVMTSHLVGQVCRALIVRFLKGRKNAVFTQCQVFSEIICTYAASAEGVPDKTERQGSHLDAWCEYMKRKSS